VKRNVGGLDRLFRLAVGFASAAFSYATDDTALRLLLGFVAVLGIGTSLFAYCPIHAILGIDTTAKKGK